MPQDIFLYQEYVYLDNLPSPVEAVRVFQDRNDALKFFYQQHQNYAQQFPDLNIAEQTQTIYDDPQDQVADQDDLVINTGFSEVKDGQRKLRVNLRIRKLPLE